MKKTLLFVLVLLGIATVANGQDVEDWVKLHEPHIYNDMPYRLMKPINFDPDKSYPVIVSLHHGGCKGTDNLKQFKPGLEFLTEEQNRKDYPCYVVAPQTLVKWGAEHLQNIKDIINDLPAVDMDRIYVLGHSMGGAGTYTFIQSDPEYFAAAAPSAGSGLANRESTIDATIINDIPIWAFHGDQDDVCPIDKDQKIFAKMKEVGGNMKLTTWVGDGHPVEPKMFRGGDNGKTECSSARCDEEPDFLKWLFAQKRIYSWIKPSEPGIYNGMLYRLLRPKNFDPQKNYPVVVSLHSAGGKGSDNLKQMRTVLQRLTEDKHYKANPCYIVAPQSLGGWDEEHLQNIKDIINDLPSVDMNRIYVFGHSMGGGGTYRFIQYDPNYFAAAGSSAGGRHTNIDVELIKDVPLWTFFGDQDNIDDTRKLFAKMQEIGGNMKFTTWVDEGHGVGVKMVTGGDNGITQLSSDRCDPEPVFSKWLFSKKRPDQRKKLYEPRIQNDMPYRLLKPLNFNPEERYPVIVSLHGAGGKGTDNLRQMNTGLEILAQEQNRKDYPCYIIAPQSQGGWDSKHLQNVKEIINDLPSVDKRRIYVMGHSMGGAGTYTFIQSDPDYFAAAAPIAGSGLAKGNFIIDASLIKDVPIWAFHGDQDKICPIEKDQKIFAKMQELGGKMKLTTWKGDGHGIETKMFSDDDNGTTELSSNFCDPQPDFMRWLFSHKLGFEWKEVYEYHIYDDMQYRLLRPNNFDPKKKYPVVVALHSAAGRATDNRKQLERWHFALTEEHQKNEDYNSYIVAPQSPGRWTPKHLEKVKDIISDLPATDMDRIYVFGHSMGGSGTYTFVQADPKYFAAAAASAGGGDDIDVSTFKDLPMWIFYGDQDKIERARTIFAKMQKIGGNMKFTTWVGDGHPVAPQMINGKDNGVTVYSSDKCDPEPVFLKWIFAQKLTK